MQSKLGRAPVWVQLLIVTLVCLLIFDAVIWPIVWIGIKYDFQQPLSTLPVEYWLLILMEVLGFFILAVALWVSHYLKGDLPKRASLVATLRKSSLTNKFFLLVGLFDVVFSLHDGFPRLSFLSP